MGPLKRRQNRKPGERWILVVRNFHDLVVPETLNSGAISIVLNHLVKDRSEPWQNGGSLVVGTPTRQEFWGTTLGNKTTTFIWTRRHDISSIIVGEHPQLLGKSEKTIRH